MIECLSLLGYMFDFLLNFYNAKEIIRDQFCWEIIQNEEHFVYLCLILYDKIDKTELFMV